MRSTDAQKRDATRVLSVRRVMFAALVACALVFGGALLPAVPGSSAVPNATGASAVAGASANSAASDDPGTSDDSEVFAGKAFADPVQSSSEDNSKEVRIGYYYGDEAFQDGFGDDERNRGTPTNTTSAWRPMPAGITPIATSRAARPSRRCETAKWTLLPASTKRPSSRRNSSSHLRIWGSMAIRSTSR